MKKLKTCLAFFICCILSLNMVICNVKADNNVVLSNKAYLLKTGMPQKEIEKLDDDVMQFIVDDLKSGGKHFEYINSNIENQISILSSETLTGISFTASAFKNASTIYIYPTYEFTSNKQPRGKDSFSFQLGAAMRPYEYGGKLWYKDNTMNDWKVGGTLTANNQHNTEDIKTKEPDVILRASHAMPEQVQQMFADEFEKNDIWKHFAAVQNGRVYDLDSSLFGMSANFSYQQALEALQPMLYNN